MKYRMTGLLASSTALFLSSFSAVSGEPFSIRLVDELDEPEFYCLDITGWGDHLALDNPLQIHTCKPGSPDQQFVADGASLRMPEYDRCLTISASGATALPGVALLVRTCDDLEKQQFSITDAGRIRYADSSLCLAASAMSLEASGPSHMWRVASLQPCDSTDPALTTWTIHPKTE